MKTPTPSPSQWQISDKSIDGRVNNDDNHSRCVTLIAAAFGAKSPRIYSLIHPKIP